MSKRGGSRRPTHRTGSERAIEEIYKEIPTIPSCTGACATACGPIVMFTEEWKRVKRSMGDKPLTYIPGSLRCPMLSPTGRCMVYSVRPYICRLWGTTDTLACPEGCQPTRWLTREQAHEIFVRLREVTGPGVDGPVGAVEDIWDAFALEEREERARRLEQIRQSRQMEVGTDD